MKAILPLFLALATVCAVQAKAAPAETDRDQLLRIERERLDATIRRDVDGLKRLTTDDLNYVHASGKRQNQAQYLAYIAGGGVMLASYSIQDETVRIVGDAAVTHGLFNYTTAASPEPARSGKTLFTAVYFRDRGQWRLHAWEATIQP